MLSVLRNTISYTWCGCLLLSAAQAHAATPSLSGQTGYINMPSAKVEPDGTFSLGYSYDRPYGTLWLSTTILPILQVTGRFVSIAGTPGFSNVPGEFGSEYGRYKDKVADARLRLLEEQTWLPAIAIGATDLFGTEKFKGKYIVATKTFGAARNIEASIGYGKKRPEGMFAGARWSPRQTPNWAVVAEYDANNYPKDFRANETAAGTRRSGPSIGLEYKWGWLGAQVARHRDHFSANLYASIPLSEREFLPKLFEPPYYQQKNAPPRATLAEWQENGRPAATLVQALAKQDFKNIRVAMEGATLKLMLSNSRISNMGRAVGRAARTALAFAPVGTRSIQVVYTRAEQPVLTYEFLDIHALGDYLGGLTKREAFMQTVLVRYADPADRIDVDDEGMLAGIDDGGALGVHVGREGAVVQLSSEDRESNRFKLQPKLGLFFNDSSGALRYELAAVANYDRRLRNGLYLNSALRLNLAENVSGVKMPSNSLLPHVRTDIADYKRGGKFKLNRLMVNQYLQPAERVYARLSGGFYEEMFRGAGGQLLYLPKDSRWAADVSVDALQQRGYKGWFDKRDYHTVTAIGALHYRLPYDIRATARVGRFLAEDRGVRVEFKRRFRSGVEVGAWYTKTNGKDITGPGSPSAPYNDKGVFLSIPFNSILLADTQSSAGISIAPWTRDVGQMVASPGDLYDMLEQPQREISTHDGLGNFAERADEKDHPAVDPIGRTVPNPWPAFRLRLSQAASGAPAVPDALTATGVALGAVAASALLDKPADRLFKKHADGQGARSWASFGKKMPLALAGMAGVAVAFGDEREQNMGVIALQSVAGALGLSMGAKYVVNRARPNQELGPWERNPKGVSRSEGSFPSNHAAVAFAAVTPFAQEYEAPWLYGLAAFSAAGRVAGRQHWVSDTVAGGVIGYAVGSWLWQAQRDNTGSRWSIAPGPKSVSVAWQTSY